MGTETKIREQLEMLSPPMATLFGLAIGMLIGTLLALFFAVLWLTREDVLDEMQAAGGRAQWATRRSYSAGDLEAQSELLRKLDVELGGIVKNQFEKGESLEVLVGLRRAGSARGQGGSLRSPQSQAD